MQGTVAVIPRALNVAGLSARDLEAISELCPEVDEPTATMSRGRDGHRSESISQRRLPALTLLRDLCTIRDQVCALFVIAHKPPERRSTAGYSLRPYALRTSGLSASSHLYFVRPRYGI